MEFLLGVSLVLNLVIVGFCIFLVKEEKKEKGDLLNRLMAKDYKEYATFKHINKPTPEPKVSIFDTDVYPVN
jgi:hypothetical protein